MPKGPNGQKRPGDVIGAAIMVGRIATGEVEDNATPAHLTKRMSMRRFTRLTNAYLKKIDSHIHALSLYFVFYNFIFIHKTLRMSPAMAAGISDKLWSMEDVVAMIDDRAPEPKKRGP